MNSGMDDVARQDARLRTAGDWLIRLEEDDLSEAEVQSWIEWCEADGRNLAAFESLQPLWHGARAHAPQPAARLVRRRSIWPVALAASFVVLAVAAGIVFEVQRRGGPTRVAEIDLVQTPVAGNRQAVLPDGSQVEVGARSMVSVDFASESRRLHLQSGEAFFQVKRDRTRPFVVEVEGLRIVAIGTAFNVRRSGSEVAVTVQEGIVEVRRVADTSAPGQSGTTGRALRAAAGQQLVFDSRSGDIRESLVDPAVALAWRTGRLEFTGDSLRSVVASVNRYTRHPIVLDDPGLETLTFTGTVFFDSIDAWVDSLPQIYPVSVDRSGGTIVLEPRER